MFIERETQMKKLMLVAAVAAMATGTVAAQEGPWMVRARAVNLIMENKDEVAGGALGLSVNNKVIPEVDISYFFNPNVAAELILTVPQRQQVLSSGSEIGSFNHLPPTLMLQYHFTNLKGFKPYVGVGYNYTKISSANVAGGTYTLDSHSTGLAYQVGVDIPLDKKWSINIDYKKVNLQTDVYTAATGVNNGSLKLNPGLLGVGVGYRF